MSPKKQADKKTGAVQATLFTFGGGDAKADLTFVRVSEEVSAVGDTITFNMNSATYNADKACLTIFDGEGNALGVHNQHSPEMLKHASEKGWTLGATDGDRFGPAFQNAGLLKGYTAANEDEAWANIATAINNAGGVLIVTMVETKSGGSYRRWTVNPVA